MKSDEEFESSEAFQFLPQTFRSKRSFTLEELSPFLAFLSFEKFHGEKSLEWEVISPEKSDEAKKCLDQKVYFDERTSTYFCTRQLKVSKFLSFVSQKKVWIDEIGRAHV